MTKRPPGTSVRWFGSRRRKEGKRRSAAPFNIAAIRIRELERLFVARYGQQLPDDDAGRDDIAIMAHHLANTTRGDPVDRIRRWVRERAPWVTDRDLEVLIESTLKCPRRWRADTLGCRLGLTVADRDALGITTIGAVDMEANERIGLRREKNRAAQTAQRRARGVCPRQKYEAGSISREKPWEALGMSRPRGIATANRARETSPWTAHIIYYADDGPVSKGNMQQCRRKPENDDDPMIATSVRRKKEALLLHAIPAKIPIERRNCSRGPIASSSGRVTQVDHDPAVA